MIKSDNGPPFNSEDFKNFCVNMNIVHRKISPYWPRANGEAESFMRNMSKVIQTAKIENVKWEERLREFLRNYRSTPHSTTKIPPVDLIFRNAYTARLPNIQPFLKSNLDNEAIKNDTEGKKTIKLRSDQVKNPKYNNFNIGEQVLVRQKADNKAFSAYDPRPLKIIDIKGSMITGKFNEDDKCITRNSSYFKKFIGNQSQNPEYHLDSIQSNSERNYLIFSDNFYLNPEPPRERRQIPLLENPTRNLNSSESTLSSGSYKTPESIPEETHFLFRLDVTVEPPDVNNTRVTSTGMILRDQNRVNYKETRSYNKR